MKQHFVEFKRPGTFLVEISTFPIESWDVAKAIGISKTVVHAFAFQFVTRERGENDLDSHETARSGNYFLVGKIETLEEIEARNDPSDHILLANMRGNGWDSIITGVNGYKWTQPFLPRDVIVSREVQRVCQLERLPGRFAGIESKGGAR